ncbi:sce7726 family protein [Aquibacillus sp. 3ASR75-11]|uniref:Sce7726 family protein n=1 Tax=Terrihalobacillus insolitus TaxID=2950438 RepID=A0A9X3WRQ4_9BACI|nr:sce7726 family protein [Terrihalobacillus insolitus]MDC3411856.1 sce7726 family protein [Terrihalobacillus insolitus]MDC3423468.1 sce7726 family protein [Terrihalobacillus insolitus]
MSQEMMHKLKQELNDEQLGHYAKLLYRSYNFNLTNKQIWDLIYSSFEGKFNHIFDCYSRKYVANEAANELIMTYVPAEKTIKYNFIKNFVDKEDEVTFFEMYTDSSRVDLCRVNGKSIAYEIKTEIDGLTKLPKQLNDYSKLFEYIYVITDEKHIKKVLDIVPFHCGVIKYRFLKGECIFSYKKAALKSPDICPEAQIRNLSSRDIELILKKQQINAIPSKKNERINLLLELYQSKKINSLFKWRLQSKYAQQWDFVKNHFQEIYPIDIQPFFHHPIDPDLTYCKPSFSDKVYI